jgi:hypothetical protein
MNKGARKTWVAALLAIAGTTPARLALIPLAAVAVVPAGIVVTGAPGSEAIAAAIADPLSVLDARSPGARAPGALTSSKPLKAADVQKRVLSNLNGTPGAATPSAAAPLAQPVAPADAPGTIVPAVVAAGPGEAASIAPLVVGGAPGAAILPGIAIAPGVVGGGGGGGAGGGGGPVGTTPVTPGTPVTPVPAIPEPETWLTLLLGFGAIGGAMRFRRRGGAATAATPDR